MLPFGAFFSPGRITRESGAFWAQWHGLHPGLRCCCGYLYEGSGKLVGLAGTFPLGKAGA